MDSLTSHWSTGLLAEGGTSAGRAFSSSSKVISSSWIRFFQAPKKMGSDHAIFLDEKKLIRWFPPPPSSSLPTPPEASENVVESGIQTSYQSKYVHVRFVLQKACLFGQQFLLVGDDPIFGLWDPSNAVPLEWSDGHAWIAELDLPVGKSIQFKFILRDLSGEINWQPGPDRFLKVWETTKTIVVTEEWENAEEKIIEEEPLANLTEEVISIESTIGINSRAVNNEPQMGMIARTQVGMTDERLSQSTNKEKKLTSCEGDLVLVPGLTPVPVPVTASIFPKEVGNGKMADASLASDEAEKCNALQSSGEQAETAEPNGNLLEEETVTSLEKPCGDGVSQEKPSFEEELHSEDFSCEGDLVLVPGLTHVPVPVPVPVTASIFPKEVVNDKIADASLASDEAEKCNALQLSGEQAEAAAPNGNLLEEETMTSSEKPCGDGVSQEKPSLDFTPCEEKLHSEDSSSRSTGGVPRNDILRMLHRFLLNLGLKKNLLI